MFGKQDSYMQKYGTGPLSYTIPPPQKKKTNLKSLDFSYPETSTLAAEPTPSRTNFKKWFSMAFDQPKRTVPRMMTSGFSKNSSSR